MHCHCVAIDKIWVIFVAFLGPGDGMAIVVQLPEGEARFVAVDLEPLSVAA